MIKSERIAKKINEEIKNWEKPDKKLIIAIDGYAGSGKTTISDFISKQNPSVLTIHLDDFIQHFKDRKEMIDKAKDKSQVFEYSWYRYNDLEKLIKEFKSKDKGLVKFKTYDYIKNNFGPKKSFDLSKKVLIIEGIFLFHPKHKVSKMWDKTIYIDTDPTKADKKRVAREKNRWGRDYVSENHPDNWIKYYKTAYKRYIQKYKPTNNRDIVFNV